MKTPDPRAIERARAIRKGQSKSHDLSPTEYQLLSSPLSVGRNPDFEHANREAHKRRIAKNVLPFIKEITFLAEGMPVTYDRTRVELIVEACRDYLMAEAEADPDLNEEQRVAIAEIVTGLAKGWPFARELLDAGALEKLLPMYIVVLDKMDVIAKAIRLEVHDGPVDRDLVLALAEPGGTNGTS